MNLHHLTYCEYELPLRTPFHTARGSYDSRRGLLVALFGESGAVGIGEVAPFEEFHTESLSAARAALARLAAEGIPPSAPDHYGEFFRWHEGAGLNQDELPATVFGIDCALAGLSMSLALRGRKHTAGGSYFRVNALLQGSTAEELLGSARYFASRGFATVKLKAGVLPVEQELEIVKRLHAELPALKIRVDANGAWSQRAALEFCSQAQQCGVEYVEDPAPRGDTETLIKLRDACQLRVALDDFWAPGEIALDRIDWSLLNVLVLKPVRIGSMARIELIERLATEHAVDVVYTSMLESSVGIACTIGFMSAAHNWELAHGLDTARWLNTDTLVEPLISRAGRLRQIDVTALPRMIREPYRSVLGIR